MSKAKIRSKSAAVPTVSPTRKHMNAQISRIFDACAIVRSVQALIIAQGDEGSDTWRALDVVQETLKGVAASLDDQDNEVMLAEVAHV